MRHAVPKVVEQFHAIHWKEFLTSAFPPWQSMIFKEKSKHLRAFLLAKFSMNPHLQCMLPRPGAKRKAPNDACWIGFELRDAEMESLVVDVMGGYAQGVEQPMPRPLPAQSMPSEW